MKDGTTIQYLTHGKIDKRKWDTCIDGASNGRIYAYSFYLDTMAKHWDALILGDYETVMPLTWNSKLGIPYLYQPFLTAELGIFGKMDTTIHTKDFIEAIPKKFRLIEIALNSENVASMPNINHELRSNYTLPLHSSYDQIYDSYRENSKRNIRKSAQLGCTFQKNFEVEQVIDLAWQQMRAHNSESLENVNRFRDLYRYLYAKKMANTYGVFSRQNELLASCVFFFSHGRAYYILVGNHPNGRTLGASHALIDYFIKEHANSELLLDFEGSDIQSLAFFYSSFGANRIAYPFVKINRLPFYLKWLKK